LPLIYAGMMELVDMRDLGSRAAMRWGSSPHARTKLKSCILTAIIGQMQLFILKMQCNRSTIRHMRNNPNWENRR
jgi:hypothetical protein